jgi:hypothetical protein
MVDSESKLLPHTGVLHDTFQSHTYYTVIIVRVLDIMNIFTGPFHRLVKRA